MPNTIRLRLLLKQLSPIAIAGRRGTTSSFIDTLDYVPGTALRGAVAAHYLRGFGTAKEKRFQEIFLNGGVLFVNLYPVKKADISHVLPATAYSCKAYKEAHGVRDILTRAAALKLLDQHEDQSLLGEIIVCPECRRPTHNLTGYYEKFFEKSDIDSPENSEIDASENSDFYAKVEAHKRFLTHVGINRQTQTAEFGFLFAQQVISEAWREAGGAVFKPQVFSGDLIVSETYLDFLTNELLARNTNLRVGESRTRGLGRIQVQDWKDFEPDTAEAIRSRIRKFNKIFSDYNRTSQDREYLALTLHSDAVLNDVFMRPKATIEVEDINRALGDDYGADFIASDALQLKYSNAAGRLVQSWNLASGYPKPDDIAITKGSVFLYELTSGAAEKLAEPLALLQERGIGKRRMEGFGRVNVCDPFHWEEQKPWQAK